jgi:hypothetical protein
MTNMHSYKTVRGGAVLNASRQMWLAGLGAAVVTREWAEKEAGQVFRTLVREGSAMESRAIRYVGDRVDASVVRANVLWRRARTTVESTVRAYADTAVTIVRRTLPRSLPKVEFAAARDTAKPRKIKARRISKTAGVTVRRAKRAAKGAAKR